EATPVAAAPALAGEGKAAEQVVLVRIGSGQVPQKVGLKADRAREGNFQGLEILLVVRAVGQADVHAARRLHRGVVALLVQGDGEGVRITGEDGGGAVALVDIEVHDGHAADIPPARRAPVATATS